MKKTPLSKVKMTGDIPPPRFGHTFTMVSKTKAVLFGGAVSVSGKFIITNQSFLYDFQTNVWKKLNFYNGLVPSQRAAHAATCVADMQMVVYGGAASNTQGLLKDELYLLDLRKEPVWKVVEVVPKNNTPGQRYGHTMVYNKPHLIIFAGNSGNKVQNDVWFINFQRGPFSWTKYEFENGRMPCPRVYHSAALCEQGKATGMMVVFGGRRQSKKDHNGSQRDLNVSALNDVWGLVKHRNGVWDWNTPPKSDNYVPICRYQHLVCFVGSKLVIMGGRTNNPEEPVSAIQAYDTQTAEWTKVSSISRYRHAIALQKNCKLFVHGGFEPELVSQPLDTLVCLDLSGLLSTQTPKQLQSQRTENQQYQVEPAEEQNIQNTNNFQQIEQQQQLSQRKQLLSQTQPNLLSNLIKNTPNRASKLGLREIGDSQRNVSNSRIRNNMQKSRHERQLTPSRIINSSKNTRLSSQVVVAKGDKGTLQFQKVPVNSLMEQSKKLNNMNYEDSSCSGVFDQGLLQLVDNILMMLMPLSGVSKIINSSLFPLKKDKIYRLCHQTSKLLASESSLIGVRAPIKVFGSIYGQHSELLRFFETFDFPDERQMETFGYIFLGNYVDKGFNSLETICLLMSLKIKYPEHIHLLRGRHEDININRVCGFGEQCEVRLGQNINDPQSIFQTINNMFELLPLAAAVQDKFLCVSGGVGRIDSLHDIKNIVRPAKVKDSQVITDLLWSDGGPLMDGYMADRYSDEEMQGFLDDNGLDMIINTKDGLPNGVLQNKYELSIFSVPNFNGKNNKGCILKINKNLQVLPQVLKAPPLQNQSRPVQWVNQNECKVNLGLTQGQMQYRQTIFQV